MESSFPAVVNLLHRCQEAAIATNSGSFIGFPSASVACFVADDHHRPVFLMSASMEDARDLSRDERASLVVFRHHSNGGLERATMVGSARPIDPEPLLVERFLRYHPDVADQIQGGDTRFFRLTASQLVYVGKGVPARWMAADHFQTTPWLPLAFERDVINSLDLPANVSVLGVDCFGIDLMVARTRQRFTFGQPIVVAGKARAVAQDLLDRLRR